MNEIPLFHCARHRALPPADSAGCLDCRDGRAMRAAVALALSVRSELPQEARSGTFLEGVYERALAVGEASVSGSRLVTALVETPPPARELAHDPQVQAALALAHVPTPTPSQWGAMRDSLLAGAQPVAGIRIRYRNLGWLGVAASVLAYFAFSETRVDIPQIVFVDLDARPSIEFSIVRGGAIR